MKVNNVTEVDKVRIVSKNGTVIEITDTENGDISIREVGLGGWCLAVIPQSSNSIILTTPHQRY